MNPATPQRTETLSRHPSTVLGIPSKWARSLVLRQLRELQQGCLTIEDSQGTHEFRGAGLAPNASVRVYDDAFYRALGLHGSLGAAESYMRGEWHSPDLTALIRLMLVNRDAWKDIEPAGTGLRAPLNRFLHFLRRNTLVGARRNIVAHYDLGTEFFELFLDPTLSYSCGIFEQPEATLEEASVSKIDRACRKLGLRPDHQLLEIGTGWGALAVHAAREYGCRVVTTTLSHEQHERACRRVQEQGLADRVQVLCRDYRSLEGTFDRVVSIEMLEAVGAEYYDAFFEQVDSLLTPDGMALLQVITIQDQAFDRAKETVDFIKRYIFPGSCIPSVSALLQSATRASSMKLVHLEDLTPHYAETLRRWRSSFLDNLDDVRQLGFSEEFIRMWEFYLCYCEGGFEERYIGDVQLMMARPENRSIPILPPLS
ncbi:MAG: cyclopropane-fatty-acyl-phospholipid synthase [Candidatus Binatia bacterium]|nr:cyclopropane-fatty-acyl-phospholipid synthase [Candidatus Binatia bacterium]